MIKSNIIENKDMECQEFHCEDANLKLVSGLSFEKFTATLAAETSSSEYAKATGPLNKDLNSYSDTFIKLPKEKNLICTHVAFTNKISKEKIKPSWGKTKNI